MQIFLISLKSGVVILDMPQTQRVLPAWQVYNQRPFELFLLIRANNLLLFHYLMNLLSNNQATSIIINQTLSKISVFSLKIAKQSHNFLMFISPPLKPTIKTSFFTRRFHSYNFYTIMENSSIHKQHLQKLYNQNAVVEDSELTSFCYLKTLALQFLIVIFTMATIVAVLINYFNPEQSDSTNKLHTIIFLFTILTIVTIVFEKLSVLEWIKEKKDYEKKPRDQFIFMAFEILVIIPCPNPFIGNNITINSSDISGNSIAFAVDDLLSAYVLLRCLYFLKFLIHYELFYGSRPDRLSRLYTVKFGTFNAFKFLINEKPEIILIVIFVLNYLLLPLILLFVESKVNTKLDTFIACLYYQVVTQVTVGYGDITVNTPLGRGIMVVSIIIGITTTSILLIFFMRLMEQDSNEEESHSLLSILEQKKELAKAMVERVETQVTYLSKKVPAQKRQENVQKLNEFKFKNSRKIRYQQESTPNLKRMMMGNFAALLQGLNELKETEIMLSKYVKIIENSNSLKIDEIESEREL